MASIDLFGRLVPTKNTAVMTTGAIAANHAALTYAGSTGPYLESIRIANSARVTLVRNSESITAAAAMEMNSAIHASLRFVLIKSHEHEITKAGQ